MISFKRKSESSSILGCFTFKSVKKKQSKIKINIMNDFILCHFDSFYWIGMAEEINFVEKDIKVKFMHPQQSFIQLHFLSTADDC